MTPHSSLIARVVLQQFSKLPTKRKPRIRDNGLHEWVPLSGIVAERNGTLTCLALATGMKCLPASKLQESNGVGIHDEHAEILAIRTFNRFLLDECQNVENGSDSEILKRTDKILDGVYMKPYEIRDDVKLYMYCSEAPCGDASMELTMAAQDDASPWVVPIPHTTELASDAESKLPGRGYFSQLGIVRRKPARGDAPPTLSKSCSDKLALKQCTSLLSSLTSLFIDPTNAYIHTLLLPETQYSETACRRAFSVDGRMKPLTGAQWRGGYAFKPFSVATTELEFEYSRRTVQVRSKSIAPSNIAAAWSANGIEESIVGGVLQGRKAFQEKGASRMSRRRMWEGARALAESLGKEHLHLYDYLRAGIYKDIKDGAMLAERRQVKEDARQTALAGWLRNDRGSDFRLEEHCGC